MDSYLYLKLIRIYPDKVVSNLATEDTQLYYYIRKAANGKSIEDFLKDNGFGYITGHRGIPGKEFDVDIANLLINEYDFKGTDFAKLLNLTRAEISRKIRSKVKNAEWESDLLTDSEIEHIKHLLVEKEYKLDEEDLYIQIANNGKNVCVLIKNNDLIKVVFKFPKELDDLLRNNKYHIFREEDTEIRKDLVPAIVMGRYLASYRVPNVSLRISKRCQQLSSISRDEYLKLHGFDGFCDGRTTTDAEIVAILKKYSDENDIVYFPSTGPDKPIEYDALAIRASREKMGLDVFFEFFGFFKEDSRSKTSFSMKLDKFRSEVSDCLIGEGNKVYIKSDSPLYKRLYPFARRRNLTVDGLLLKLDFERVFDNTDNTEFELFTREHDTHNGNIGKILYQLQQIEGSLKSFRTEDEKNQRNQKIVKLLKELYSYRCQLCSKDGLNLPPIEKKDGTYYVEVHHIKPVAESDASSDEIIDIYTNAIVVCPFHHKVLHFHQGGYRTMLEQEDKLFFISEKGSRLGVEKNYHLKVIVK